MKVRFTGQAEASVTYLGKHEVSTGSVLDVDDADGNALLQTGHFQVVEDAKPAAKSSTAKDETETKKSDSTSKDKDDKK